MVLSQVNEWSIIEDLGTWSTYRETADLGNFGLAWRNVRDLHLAENNSFQQLHYFSAQREKNFQAFPNSFSCNSSGSFLITKKYGPIMLLTENAHHATSLGKSHSFSRTALGFSVPHV